jgi:hypothetical protein
MTMLGGDTCHPVTSEEILAAEVGKPFNIAHHTPFAEKAHCNRLFVVKLLMKEIVWRRIYLRPPAWRLGFYFCSSEQSLRKQWVCDEISKPVARC